ncbi:Hypothetical protein A7982_07237 [Minicystis rosea]|nr:Hypothetical protein A7982_07237 [Minicystis rosea]
MALRRSLMRLKPDTDPAEDTASVRRVLRDSAHMYRLVDDTGRLQSFTGFQVHEPEGSTGPLLFEVVHSYSRREARGHPLLAWMLVRVGLPLLQRGIGRERWMIGIGVYPQSYRLAHRYGARCTSSLDPRLPEYVRRTTSALAAERYGARWQPDRHIIRLRTIPEDVSPRWLARARGSAWWNEYQRINPDWREGWGANFASPVGVSDVMSAMSGAVQRRLRRDDPV